MVPLPGIIMREHRAVSHRFMVLQGLRVTFLVESSPERLPDDHVLRDVALGQLVFAVVIVDGGVDDRVTAGADIGPLPLGAALLAPSSRGEAAAWRSGCSFSSWRRCF